MIRRCLRNLRLRRRMRRCRIMLLFQLGRRCSLKSIQHILHCRLCLLGRLRCGFGSAHRVPRFIGQQFAVAGSMGISFGHSSCNLRGPISMSRAAATGRLRFTARMRFQAHMRCNAPIHFLLPCREKCRRTGLCTQWLYSPSHAAKLLAGPRREFRSRAHEFDLEPHRDCV